MSTIDAPLVYVTQSGQIFPSGYTSSNLPQGVKGPQGDKGDTGVKGAKGEKGESRLLHQYAQSRAGEQVKITVVTAANNPTVDLNDISIVEEPSH